MRLLHAEHRCIPRVTYCSPPSLTLPLTSPSFFPNFPVLPPFLFLPSAPFPPLVTAVRCGERYKLSQRCLGWSHSGNLVHSKHNADVYFGYFSHSVTLHCAQCAFTIQCNKFHLLSQLAKSPYNVLKLPLTRHSLCTYFCVVHRPWRPD